MRIVFFDNTLGRFLDLREFGRGLQGPLNDAYSAEKDYSPFVYPKALVYLPLPWTPIFAVALWRVFTLGKGSELRSFLKFAWVTLPVVLTLSSSKVALYLAPILWVYLIAAGEWLADRSPRRVDRTGRQLRPRHRSPDLDHHPSGDLGAKHLVARSTG